MRVVSEKARENGLGSSLLERLFDHYKANGHLVKTHTATLLTNYRCHPSILMMASSLFYEHTLVSRSRSVAHPKAPYPLVMACTSFEEKGFENLSVENLEEARLLISKMIEFIRSWPREDLKQPIGLLASTKQQVGVSPLFRLYTMCSGPMYNEISFSPLHRCLACDSFGEGADIAYPIKTSQCGSKSCPHTTFKVLLKYNTSSVRIEHECPYT